MGNKKTTTGRNNLLSKCSRCDISQRYNIRTTEILTFAVNFPSGVILLAFIIYTKENRPLCVLTFLCTGNIELYSENCPWFIWKCPWFMPNSCEVGAILKRKLPLILAGLFQGLMNKYKNFLAIIYLRLTSSFPSGITKVKVIM